MDLDSPPNTFMQLEEEELCSNAKSGTEMQQAVVQPSDGGEPSRPGSALAIFMSDHLQGYLLVEPNLAKGTYGQVSIWLGLLDRKLYTRKVQRERYHGETPKDGTHYFRHPNVPRLVSHFHHGPQPADLELYGDDDLLPRVWSTITEYIDGFKLDKTITKHGEESNLIPEAEIWKCGATLLEIIAEMHYLSPGGINGDYPIIHGDIWLRNVIVEPSRSGSQTAKYWLIDFGSASRLVSPRRDEMDEEVDNGDAETVGFIIFAMIQGSTKIGFSFSQDAKQFYRTDLYSSELYDQVLELREEAREAAKEDGSGMSKERLQYWSRLFRQKAEEHQQTPFPFQLYTKDRPQPKRPVLATSKLDMEALLTEENEIWGCYRYAWVDADTLKVKHVEPKRIWGRSIPPFMIGLRLGDGDGYQDSSSAT